MPTRPHHHPLADPSAGAGRQPVPARVIELRHRSPTRGDHPAASSEPTTSDGTTAAGRASSEDGSVATEYGLLAVVAATIVSVLLEWATSGGISALLGSILDRVSDLVGL
ncbi:hypothetical protein [Salsipaludibacter albus]|uniref:hypothetical protein n=1 Tax=Salsipaludibacter albus TaxID=2849650 RepID=UPI001EE472A5|nr:hypothetical protein [Salsipaludibacter albus]MBY5161786.1 hypothetical protein [Salsipaludibacter albus]